MPAGAVTVLALLMVWAGLDLPDRPEQLGLGALLRLPVELIVGGALVLVLPRRLARSVAWLGGAGLAGLVLQKIADLTTYALVGKPFDVRHDLGYLPSGYGVLRDALGPVRAGVVGVGIALAVVAIVALTTAATVRLLTATRRLRGSALAIGTLALAWTLLAGMGLPAAGSQTALLADRRTVAETPLDAPDPYAETPGDALLSGLRGHDVLIVFVESYGRVALEDPGLSGVVQPALLQGEQRLRSAGYGVRSGFLTSPTFAGISWLAHSTLESGLWIDDQRRYDELLAGHRLSLARAFGRAGWRTVADVPANESDWPQGIAYYGWQTVYDSRNVGYAGPPFGYASMPDQYTLARFGQLELTAGHPPVMAEIDLVSSHGPWAPLPPLVPDDQLGDGSIFRRLPAALEPPSGGDWHAAEARAAYAQSVAYTMTALTRWLQRQHDQDLVLVVLGDHQPAALVSGQNPGRDVPVSIIAHDPAVLRRIDDWQWQPTLRPAADAPVWPMDAFRDRFLAAYR